MFQVKICGVTTPADAVAAAQAGADALGLNFCPASPRCLSHDQARLILKAVSSPVLKVGVFADAPPGAVLAAADQLGLDLVQLHGDEAPELLAHLTPRPVIKALRGNDLGRVADYVDRCRALGVPLAAVLLDSAHAGRFGGTGQALDWPSLAQVRDLLPGLPWILAGGLGPHNVAAAVAAAQPHAVDAASGVESTPGRKSPLLMADFVRAARTAFGQLPR
jgi:phosphoribosylanthranilate isomerase